MNEIRIVIVEDDSLDFAGTLFYMGSAQHIRVVGKTDNAEKACNEVSLSQPDVVLMDIFLKNGSMNGLEATQEILKHRPETRILIFSNYSDPGLMIAAMRSGASGYLLKTCSSEQLRIAVESVAQGMLVFDQELASKVRDFISNRKIHSHWGILYEYGLTKRQVEVAKTWHGLINKHPGTNPIDTVARDLDITPKSVQDRLWEVSKLLSVSDGRSELYERITEIITCFR